MTLLSRRDLTFCLASLSAGIGVAGAAFGAAGGNDIASSSESIHQEVLLAASRERVYAALTDADQFTKMVTFSAMKNAPPAQIAREPGGAFSLFGGHIVGRHVELLPAERIVQAWRAVNWDPGHYSIARFVLKEQSGQTNLVFDHTGFPNGKAESLAAGWTEHYWEPLKKYLA